MDRAAYDALMASEVTMASTVRFGRGPRLALPPRTVQVGLAIEAHPVLTAWIVRAARGEGPQEVRLPGERFTVSAANRAGAD